MRLLKALLLLIFGCHFITACEKDSNHGNIHLKPFYSAGVSSVTAYLKAGKNRVKENDADKVEAADALGEVYFSDLLPGYYYVFVKGYDNAQKNTISSDTIITVPARFRGNVITVSIELK